MVTARLQKKLKAEGKSEWIRAQKAKYQAYIDAENELLSKADYAEFISFPGVLAETLAKLSGFVPPHYIGCVDCAECGPMPVPWMTPVPPKKVQHCPWCAALVADLTVCSLAANARRRSNEIGACQSSPESSCEEVQVSSTPLESDKKYQA